MMTYDDVVEVYLLAKLQRQFEHVDQLKLAVEAEWNRLSQTFIYASAPLGGANAYMFYSVFFVFVLFCFFAFCFCSVRHNDSA